MPLTRHDRQDHNENSADKLISAAKRMTTEPILQSTLTCPHCGHRATETMPTNACQFFYDCAGCGELFRPRSGDCCVFCSYGSVPCPPVQLRHACCG
jgi:hypothetical protein